MSLTRDDLSLIKSQAAFHANRTGFRNLEDDFVSDSCLKLVRCELPAEPEHRQRYIRQTIRWIVADVLRKASVTPRRVLEKMKAGIPLSPRERAKVGYMESLDHPDSNWVNRLHAEQHEEPIDVRPMLSRIGFDNPVEFLVLTLRYVHGALLQDVASVLNVTESRACQIEQAGIKLLQRHRARY